MIRKLLYSISGRLPCRLIEIDGRPYLERYYVGKILGLTVYLHRFVSADGDRQVHDHPWKYAGAWVLCGWYREERVRYLDINDGWVSRYRRMWPGRVNILGPNSFHLITEIKPDTWTLFIHGPRVKSWGFLQRHSGHQFGAFYHQPYDVAESKKWQLRASRGVDSGRQPPFEQGRRRI